MFPRGPFQRDRDGTLLDLDGDELLDLDVAGFDRDLDGVDLEVDGFDLDVVGFELEREGEAEVFFRSREPKSVRMRLPRLFERCSVLGVTTGSRPCGDVGDGGRRNVVSLRPDNVRLRPSEDEVRGRISGETRTEGSPEPSWGALR